ncbi:MAG: DEAD/DEAH box helicase, partial [Anaerolineae bacterium]|nr:DEAD/DEAH box helicase [Anaerolineae bacterium]
MSLSSLLELWRKTPTIAENITAWKLFPARPAQTVPFPAELHPALLRTLRAQGIPSLYTHQAEAWDHVQAGRHLTVVTGTASGKTLGYNLPVLDHILGNLQTRALYLFPTKALAHDQAELLHQLIAETRKGPVPDDDPPFSDQLAAVGVATYDGDTPAGIRPTIRSNARIVLSNPDMLHTAILPHHTKWAEFLGHLRYVVIDEMHVYRGVFGSHVANLLRRLKRVARFYGSRPQFILTSATIANPAELAEQLIEASVTLIVNDGAAKGPKHFLIYNPPVVDVELGLRRSVLQESIRLTQELLQQNVQTIVFGRARRTIELLLRYLREA